MTDASKTDFGKWLKALRVSAGLTQKQLGAAVGTDGPHVIAWEKGRAVPGGVNLVRILRACGVQIVAATEPPPLPARPPETPAALVRAIEALAGQMSLLVEAAQKLEVGNDPGEPSQEEASA